MTPKHHKLFSQSSYDRFLDIALFMWPEIKRQVPDAEFHFAYGWQTFDALAANNPERMQWKRSVETMAKQDGVFDHGRMGQEELKKLRQECGILFYPEYFTEIFYIGGVEAQKDGLVPVVSNFKHEIDGQEVYTAIDETIGSGIKVEGNIRDPKVQEEYIKQIVALMKDKKRWKQESAKAQHFARQFAWPIQADKWIDEFKKPISMPEVSIVTPTIREGFWNIMADNIANQTYKVKEWIIVDDYREDRSGIAKEYADLYGLNIKYIRGDKALGTYDKKCGLVRANNKGWQAATGELLVWLQDFVLMPQNGIESLVDVYRHNPDALIAPVDVYYNSIEPNRDNKVDWWDGELDIIASKTWTNGRVKNEGIRMSRNPYDWEANYGAISKKILDELNGWWEFMDEGLGYDNTEICYRALESGYKLIVDDTNIAKCINLWPIIGGTSQNILGRDRMLNPPRYEWLVKQTNARKLPIIRDTKIDSSIRLEFSVPKSVKDEDCAEWINKHTDRIVKAWEEGDTYGSKKNET